MMTKKRNIIKDLQLGEISAVTIPAQSHALATIMKSDAFEPIVKYLSTMDGAKTFDEFFSDEKKRKALCEIQEETWPFFDALRNSVNSILADESISTDDKENRIRESVSQFIGAMQSPETDDIGKVLEIFNKIESGDMTKELEKVAELEKTVAELTKRAEDAETVAKMSDAEKKYLAGLDKEAADKFKAADEKTRAGMMKKSAEDDEVFKSADGVEIRKSAVGEGVFAFLKSQNDAMQEALAKVAKAEDARRTVEFSKQADEDFGNLPGENVAKVAVLKGMAAMDEATRETLSAMLKAGNDALANGFNEIGFKGGANPSDLTKSAQKATAIKKYMEDHPGVSAARAEVEVISANPELY